MTAQVVQKDKTLFTLRPFAQSDALALVNAINNSANLKYTTINLPWKLEDAQWWLSFIKQASTQKPVTEVHFAIEIQGKLVGSIGCINIYSHKGELGYWLTEDYAGSGVMSRVVAQMVIHCFNDIQLVRLFAPVLSFNEASAKVLEKNGFEREGVHKKYYQKDGAYLDALCYAKVKE